MNNFISSQMSKPLINQRSNSISTSSKCEPTPKPFTEHLTPPPIEIRPELFVSPRDFYSVPNQKMTIQTANMSIQMHNNNYNVNQLKIQQPPATIQLAQQLQNSSSPIQQSSPVKSLSPLGMKNSQQPQQPTSSIEQVQNRTINQSETIVPSFPKQQKKIGTNQQGHKLGSIANNFLAQLQGSNSKLSNQKQITQSPRLVQSLQSTPIKRDSLVSIQAKDVEKQFIKQAVLNAALSDAALPTSFNMAPSKEKENINVLKPAANITMVKPHIQHQQMQHQQQSQQQQQTPPPTPQVQHQQAGAGQNTISPELQQKIDQLIEENIHLNNVLQEKCNQFDNLQNQVGELLNANQTVAQIQQERDELRAGNRDLQEKINNLMQNSQQQKKHTEDLQQQLQNRLETLINENNKLNDVILKQEEKKQMNQQLQYQFVLLAAENERLNNILTHFIRVEEDPDQGMEQKFKDFDQEVNFVRSEQINLKSLIEENLQTFRMSQCEDFQKTFSELSHDQFNNQQIYSSVAILKELHQKQQQQQQQINSQRSSYRNQLMVMPNQQTQQKPTIISPLQGMDPDELLRQLELLRDDNLKLNISLEEREKEVANLQIDNKDLRIKLQLVIQENESLSSIFERQMQDDKHKLQQMHQQQQVAQQIPTSSQFNRQQDNGAEGIVQSARENQLNSRRVSKEEAETLQQQQHQQSNVFLDTQKIIQITNLERELNQYVIKNQNLNEKLDSLMSDHVKLQLAFEEQKAGYEERITNLQREAEQLARIAENKQHLIEQLSENLNRVKKSEEDSANELNQQIQSLREKLQEKEEEVNCLSQQIPSVNQIEETIKLLRLENDNLVSQINSANQKLQKEVNKNQELRKVIQTLEGKTKQNQSGSSSTSSASSGGTAQHNAFSNAVAAGGCVGGGNCGNNEELMMMTLSITNETEHQDQFCKLKNLFNESQIMNKDYESKLSELVVENKRLCEIVEQKDQELQELTQSYEEKLREQDEAIKHQVEQIQQLTEQEQSTNMQKQEEINQKTAMIECLSQNKQALENRISCLIKDAEQMKQELLKLKENSQIATRSVEQQYQKKAEEQYREIQRLENVIDNKMQEVAQINNELVTCRKQLREKQNEIFNQQTEQKSMLMELSEIKKHLSNNKLMIETQVDNMRNREQILWLEQDLAACKLTMQNIEQQNQKLVLDNKKLVEKLQGKHEEIEALQKQICVVEQEKLDNQNQLNQQIDSFRLQLDEMNSFKIKYESICQDQELLVNHLKETIKNQQVEIDKLYELINQKQEDQRVLQFEQQQLREKYQVILQNLEDCRCYQEQFQILKAQFEELNQCKQQMEEEIKRKEEELLNNKAMVQNKIQEMAQYCSQYDQSLTLIRAIENKINEKFDQDKM